MGITIKDALVIGGSMLTALGFVFGGSWAVGKLKNSKKEKSEAKEESNETKAIEKEQLEEN